jgi:hypothetical protein
MPVCNIVKTQPKHPPVFELVKDQAEAHVRLRQQGYSQREDKPERWHLGDSEALVIVY